MSSYLTLDWRQKQLKDFKVSHIPPGPVMIRLSYDVYDYPYRHLLDEFMRVLKSIGREARFHSGKILGPALFIDVQ